MSKAVVVNATANDTKEGGTKLRKSASSSSADAPVVNAIVPSYNSVSTQDPPIHSTDSVEGSKSTTRSKWLESFLSTKRDLVSVPPPPPTIPLDNTYLKLFCDSSIKKSGRSSTDSASDSDSDDIINASFTSHASDKVIVFPDDDRILVKLFNLPYRMTASEVTNR